MAEQDVQLRAQLEEAWQALGRQQRELELLSQQTQMQVERESERFAQLRAKLETLDRTLDRYDREELRQLFQAAKEREIRLVTLSAELEGLEYKRAVLAEEGRTLARLAALLGGDGADENAVTSFAAGLTASTPLGPAAAPDGNPGPVQGGDLGAVLTAEEADRSRLALMLHDRVAQPLYTLVLQTEALPKTFKAHPEQALADLEALKEAASRVLQDARRVIFELRPMSLDDLGLLPTLDQFVHLRAERDHFVTRIRKEGRPRALPPTVETAVFRIVEAALDNVRDHAGIQVAEVTVAFAERELQVTIADAGRGCNLRLAQASPGGTGLLGMRERARQIAGAIDFDTAPGRGMTVRLAVPLANATAGHRRALGA